MNGSAFSARKRQMRGAPSYRFKIHYIHPWTQQTPSILLVVGWFFKRMGCPHLREHPHCFSRASFASISLRAQQVLCSASAWSLSQSALRRVEAAARWAETSWPQARLEPLFLLAISLLTFAGTVERRRSGKA